MDRIIVQSDPLDIDQAHRELRTHSPAVGALVSFVGLMRDMNEGESVDSMTLEHYPGMTEKALESIVAEARQRWDLLGVSVLHRVGVLKPMDTIVLVAVASAHRGEAFRACEFIIDFLKTRAPFWKKEITPKGERWVDSRHGDEKAAQRWRDLSGT